MSRILLSLVFGLILNSAPAAAEDSGIICPPNASRGALVIIDMQPGFATRGGHADDPDNAEKIKKITEVQIKAIKQAKAYGVPIAFLEYEGGYGDTNDELKKAVGSYSNAKTFLKNSDGMFESYNTHRQSLVDFMQKNRVGSLIIAGANGGACVNESIKGALEGNCNVLAYSDAIADFNFKEFIYPYSGHYKDIHPHCENCQFSETSDMTQVMAALAKGNMMYRPSAPPALGTSDTAN